MVTISQDAAGRILQQRETELNLGRMHVERCEEGLSRENVGLLKCHFRRETGVHSRQAHQQ
jgi:hypothetical protein